MTTQEFNTFYGLYPNMPELERRARIRQITKIAKANNDLDEDTMDSVAMDARYGGSNA